LGKLSALSSDSAEDEIIALYFTVFSGNIPSVEGEKEKMV